MFGNLAMKILENLKVSIKDIHIRFEDQLNDKFGQYSFGITLQAIEIFSD